MSRTPTQSFDHTDKQTHLELPGLPDRFDIGLTTKTEFCQADLDARGEQRNGVAN